jgi:hypothetical protein
LAEAQAVELSALWIDIHSWWKVFRAVTPRMVNTFPG